MAPKACRTMSVILERRIFAAEPVPKCRLWADLSSRDTTCRQGSRWFCLWPDGIGFGEAPGAIARAGQGETLGDWR